MIKQAETSKKSFYKYKLNLLEKYIASKTIQKRTRPSQLNLQQRTIFTQSIPNQEYYFVKFKPNSHQRSAEARSHIKKNTERYPESIFMKEDLIKLSKINEDSRNEQKVTKISMLLKKLVNQQVHAQNLKTESDKENAQQNREVAVKKNLKSFRSQQISYLFRRNSKLNLKLVEENPVHLKNQKQQEHSLHNNTTSRKSHIRYASTATKLKLKYKRVESGCLGTLKVFKCENKYINIENQQKNRKKPSTSKQNSPRDETKIDFKVKDQLLTIKQENEKKLPKMTTYRLSQSQKMPIKPWSNHYIMINDPNQMIQ